MSLPPRPLVGFWSKQAKSDVERGEILPLSSQMLPTESPEYYTPGQLTGGCSVWNDAQILGNSGENGPRGSGPSR